jgi:hypothetical protein
MADAARLFGVLQSFKCFDLRIKRPFNVLHLPIIYLFNLLVNVLNNFDCKKKKGLFAFQDQNFSFTSLPYI